MIEPFELVPAEQMVEHLRVEEMTPLIARYAYMALNRCLNYVDRQDLFEVTVAGNMPDQVAAAMLLYLGDLHSHKSAQTDSQIYENKAATALLDQVRSYRDKFPVIDDDARQV